MAPQQQARRFTYLYIPGARQGGAIHDAHPSAVWRIFFFPSNLYISREILRDSRPFPLGEGSMADCGFMTKTDVNQSGGGCGGDEFAWLPISPL